MLNAISLPLEVFEFECHPFMTSTKSDHFCDKFQESFPPQPFLCDVIDVWLGTFNSYVITKSLELGPPSPLFALVRFW